ncbi:hypothetical protein GP475_08825 [Corynebacterium poyangense]|uniref:Terminase small subunit n=1 Tax=Corynebacterium poyangense TaxID=2684405 RepID=A0A7H0SQA5_9CORY|nr:hypothetical protein [Corynebacterium poyangense]QNQ90730.1 hypothetical protein GP475_08825 [Corynebacterium poyangense]
MLWEEVHKAYEVDGVSRELVVEACRLADRCERMAAALSSKKTLWFELGEPSDLDSGGVEIQIVVNSMIGEARASQAALATTLAKIGALPKIKPKEDQRVNVLDQLAERRKARIAGAQESKEEAK